MRGRADLAAVVDDPEAHRVAHLRIFGPPGQRVFMRRVDTAGQINSHQFPFPAKFLLRGPTA